MRRSTVSPCRNTSGRAVGACGATGAAGESPAQRIRETPARRSVSYRHRKALVGGCLMPPGCPCVPPASRRCSTVGFPPPPPPPRRQRRARRDLELAVGGAQVHLDRAHRDEQRRADLGVGQALRGERGDAALAGRGGRRPLGARPPWASAGSAGAQSGALDERGRPAAAASSIPSNSGARPPARSPARRSAAPSSTSARASSSGASASRADPGRPRPVSEAGPERRRGCDVLARARARFSRTARRQPPPPPSGGAAMASPTPSRANAVSERQETGPLSAPADSRAVVRAAACAPPPGGRPLPLSRRARLQRISCARPPEAGGPLRRVPPRHQRARHARQAPRRAPQSPRRSAALSCVSARARRARRAHRSRHPPTLPASSWMSERQPSPTPGPISEPRTPATLSIAFPDLSSACSVSPASASATRTKCIVRPSRASRRRLARRREPPPPELEYAGSAVPSDRASPRARAPRLRSAGAASTHRAVLSCRKSADAPSPATSPPRGHRRRSDGQTGEASAPGRPAPGVLPTRARVQDARASARATVREEGVGAPPRRSPSAPPDSARVRAPPRAPRGRPGHRAARARRRAPAENLASPAARRAAPAEGSAKEGRCRLRGSAGEGPAGRIAQRLLRPRLADPLGLQDVTGDGLRAGARRLPEPRRGAAMLGRSYRRRDVGVDRAPYQGMLERERFRDRRTHRPRSGPARLSAPVAWSTRLRARRRGEARIRRRGQPRHARGAPSLASSLPRRPSTA